MEFNAFDTRAGSRVAADTVYAHAPHAGGEVPLRASLYLPKRQDGPVPMLVWMHGGRFTGGDHAELQIRRLARQLTIEGFALAAPQYRLGAAEADLSAPVRARLGELERMPMAGRPEQLAGAQAVAAAEDVTRFLGWLDARAEGLGLAPRPVLGGSGAGAVTAFNAAFLAPWLGLDRPEPAGILSYSGGFAWPDLYQPGRYPVFALHNPFDTELGIESIRALSQRDAGLELIEAFEQEHGALRVHPKEAKAATFGRIRAMLSRWTAEAAGA